MSEQNLNFKNIENFREYQRLIYEYINQKMIQLPLFFENQPIINNQSIPAGVMEDGGIAQKTIREGRLVKGRKVSEPIISFDNVYSESTDDLNIIQYIATKLNGQNPSEETLKVDAFTWFGIPSLEGPISSFPDYYEPNQIQGKYLYIPFIQFVGFQEKLFLNYYDGKLNLEYNNYIADINFTPTTYETFKNLLKNQYNFNCNLNPYNLSDNTGNFLPVGVKKRKISKKLLRETSDTAITEILPDTLGERINTFFRLWQKTQKVIPAGQQYILGNTFLNNGDFAGGIGPGSFKYLSNTNQIEPFNTVQFGTFGISYSDMLTAFSDNAPGLYPTWQYADLETARLSHKIIDKENPGFSPFVFSSMRNSPTWYDVQIPSEELSPGLDYTLSLWQAEDSTFNPGNYPELQQGVSFFYAVTIKENNDNNLTQEILAVDWPTSVTAGNANMTGTPIETWQGTELLWTRFKKTITLPTSENGELLALNGETFPISTHRYKIYWYVGYQNSVEGIYDGSDSDLFVGPQIRANGNQSMQYITGMRINRGEEITGINAIDLNSNDSKTIVKVLQDCIKILEPYNFDIPVYSQGKVDSLVLSQEASARVLLLLSEIREGLIASITSLATGISETYSNFATNYMQAETTDEFGDLQNLKDQFQDMINETNIATSIDALNINLTNTFQLLSSNTIAQPIEALSMFPTIQKLPSNFDAPGFTDGEVNIKFVGVASSLSPDGIEEIVTEDRQAIWYDYTRYAGESPNLFNINTYMGPFTFSGLLQGYNTNDEGYPLKVNYAPHYLIDSSIRSTPIGAFYMSELYDYQSTQGIELQEGSSEGFDLNGYPSVGYGPYVQRGGPPVMTNYGTDWKDRITAVYKKYFDLYRINNQNVVEMDAATQFQGMYLNSSNVNDNFIPLRTYVYKVSNGQDFLHWIYINRASTSTLANAYNWTELGGQIGYPGGNGGSSKPKGSRGMDYFNYDSEVIAPPADMQFTFNGPRTFRCYEPHWEFNTQTQNWNFRFAQPVAGTLGNQYTDVEVESNPDIGEAKFKFNTMHFKQIAG